MLKKIKIDALSVFFVLSLTLIGLSWHDHMIVLNERSVLSFYSEISFENNTDVQFIEGQPTSIKVLNDAFDIYYSIDGGEHFNNSGSEIDLKKVRMRDEMITIPTAVRWLPPKNCFEEVKSVSVILVDEKKQKRSNVHHFVNTSTVHHDLPIAHITIPQSQLLGEKEGIYVLGMTSWNQPGFYDAWWKRNGNFSNRGMEWERSVNFQLFENGKLSYDQQCGMRISGNATRGFSQKSLRFKARKIYEDGKFKYRLFGKGGLKKYESFVLRMSGNDNPKTLFADAFMQRLAVGSDLLTQKSRAIVLYINGNYWGIYNLRERIDDYFIAHYEDTKSKHITILEDYNAALKDGDKKNKKDFDEFIHWVKELDNINKNELKKIKKEIDLSSYIDYIFFETFYANNDWPVNNSICYRVKKGKWKWLLNDLDYSLAYPGESNVNTNMFNEIKNNKSVHVVLFNKLIKNNEFKERFINRSIENIEKFFNEDRLQQIYAEVKNTYASEIQNQIDRWRMIGSIEEWEADCEKNLRFIQKRKEVYQKHLAEL